MFADSETVNLADYKGKLNSDPVYLLPLDTFVILVTEYSRKAGFLYLGFGDPIHIERFGVKIPADRLMGVLKVFN